MQRTLRIAGGDAALFFCLVYASMPPSYGEAKGGGKCDPTPPDMEGP